MPTERFEDAIPTYVHRGVVQGNWYKFLDNGSASVEGGNDK